MVYWRFVRRNIRRTPYQAMIACMVMFLTFFVLLTFALIGMGAEQVLQFFERQPKVIAFFKEGTTDAEVENVKKLLSDTTKVAGFKYVSKEEAFEHYKAINKDDPKSIEAVRADFLPTSLEISTYNPQDLNDISQIVEKEPVVESVLYQKDVIQKLSQTTQVIRWVGTILGGFLILFSTLVILMIIGFKIRIRRAEIETMKLLGASTWFIRIPFILEGVLYGIVGATVAWGVSWVILWYIAPFVDRYVPEVPLLPVSPIFMLELLGVVLVVSAFIGLFGSMSAVRRHLKV